MWKKELSMKLMIDEIADEEPMQTGNNVADEDGDGLEDFEDLSQSERPVESNDDKIPSKRQKLVTNHNTIEIKPKCILDLRARAYQGFQLGGGSSYLFREDDR
ncbi:hypothetical protein EVAR_98103_1 [Eumeta japonica]|uniref:Uncharacterized protein n=1 Tax=Eumeta variegata TaxID=151549 RepID=A0A4C1XLL5_EUMVA|nr:hypothetical protein EVAR_98103_1 [Eumeta japonica]